MRKRAVGRGVCVRVGACGRCGAVPILRCLVYVHAHVCAEECWVVVPCQARMIRFHVRVGRVRGVGVRCPCQGAVCSCVIVGGVERLPDCCLVYVHAHVCVEECWVVVPCQACDKIPTAGCDGGVGWGGGVVNAKGAVCSGAWEVWGGSLPAA